MLSMIGITLSYGSALDVLARIDELIPVSNLIVVTVVASKGLNKVLCRCGVDNKRLFKGESDRLLR